MRNIKCENCGKETFLPEGLMMGVCVSCGHQIADNTGKKEERKPSPSSVDHQTQMSESDKLLQRALLHLEEGEYEDADKFCERVLDMDPENPRAYIAKLCAELGVTNEAELANQTTRLLDMPNYKRALRFADAVYREQLEGYANSDVEEHRQQKEMEDELFQQAVELVIETGQASISMLQRRLRIGYARAGHLIDEMARMNIVEQASGVEPREVLIDIKSFNQMFGIGDEGYPDWEEPLSQAQSQSRPQSQNKPQPGQAWYRDQLGLCPSCGGELSLFIRRCKSCGKSWR